MKQARLALLPFCLSVLMVPMGAQTASPADTKTANMTPEMRAALVRLGGQMMVAGKAYEYDRVLADDIGPRLTGSANYVKATDWAVDEFKRLGLANVHKESWVIPATWEPEKVESARIVSPHEQVLHVVSEGWSPSTPPGGVSGKIYYARSMNADALKADAGQIKDSIALVDGGSFSSEPEFLFGRFFDELQLLGQLGARAVMLGFGTTNNAPSMVGITEFVGSLSNVPFGNVGEEDTLLLRRMLERGPVEVEFAFKNRVRKNVRVENVVAEIPGREANGEYVIVGGHLDSWNPGTGAEDNGTGAASVVAVAEAVKATGLSPRRTMRFILFGGEEEGTIGSMRYAQDHASELGKCAGVFVTDTGSEPPRGWYTFGREDLRKALGPLTPVLASLGANGTTDVGDIAFETDHAPFMVQGVPSFVLWTPMEKYELLHHKPSDTFDKVNQRDLNLGAAVVGITAYYFADTAGTEKHLSAAEVEQQLKSIKQLNQYKDLVDHHAI